MVLAILLILCATAGMACAVWYSVILPLQPLKSALAPETSADRNAAVQLETHIRSIASAPHNLAHPAALEAAAAYIENRLNGLGLIAKRQTFDVSGALVRNIEVVFEPRSSTVKAGTIVLGAHYDSADDSPGAHDNGTGVSALLEIARRFASDPPDFRCRLRVVFFVNEEHPYGKTDAMGSLRHAKKLAQEGEPVAGMIALETLGYFSNVAGSQRLPVPFNLIYPDTGNFVAFVGLPGSRKFLCRALRQFRAAKVFPSTGTIAPAFIEGADLSDHWAYHKTGFPAFMITDTAPYRNPYYHQRDDLPDTVDYIALARITRGIEIMIRKLVASET